jgi:hypothetical protein
MKNSNYIAESVFKVNLNYTRLQNKTKELFFRCLDEGRDIEYFKAELEKLWGKVDHTLMEEEIAEYEAQIHERNTGKKEEIKNNNWLFALIPVSVIAKTEKKFQKVKEKEYKNSTKSYAYQNNKDEYLKLKVAKYTNQMVPYYSQSTGKLIRYVQPSTYSSMIHNTNLTRSGWNTTLYDADEMGITKFWIPYHSFSCPYCMSHQNRVLTMREVIDIAGSAEEVSGDILHPNCKCEIVFYGKDTRFNKPDYSDGELEEQYDIRQKVNSLTLRKEEVATDIKIQQRLGNQDEVDKLNQQRNKINKEIRELKGALPTTELRKQVVAINR